MQQNRAKRNPTSSHIPQSLTQILRPVTGFRDLEYFSGEDAFLYDQEVEVLLEVALMALNCLPYVPAKGILILDGQKRGEDAQCILRAPLRCGAQGSSKTYAEKAIDYIQAEPAHEQRHYPHAGFQQQHRGCAGAQHHCRPIH